MKRFLNSFKTRSFRVGGYSVFATLILIGIVVLINVAVNAVPKRYTEIDTTTMKLYTLSDETKDLVKSLDKDITLYWLTTDPDETIGNLLDRYEGLSSHVSVVQIDPEENPTFISKYDLSYYSNNSVIVDGGDRFRYVKNTEIYVTDYDYTDLEYFNYYGEYRAIESFDGEGAITSAINYVKYAILPKMYYTTGHGETTLEKEYRNGLELENVELEELLLVSSGEVPEDCDILLVNCPTGDFSDEDMAAVQAYLDRGGRMVLITSPEQKEGQRPNIQALMAAYHVIEQSGIIVESDSKLYQSGYPIYLLPRLQAHTITAPLRSGNYRAIMPMASGLKLDAEEQWNAGETITSLLRTSSGSYMKNLNAQTMEKEEGDIDGPFEVAVLVEQETETGQAAKIVWFTSQFITDYKASSLVSGANEDLFLNAVSYLAENEGGISIHAKRLTKEAKDYLQIDNATATFWEIIMIGAIPALLLAAGIYIFIRRRTK